MKTKATKTTIVIDLPGHVADVVAELSKTIDLSTLLRDALGEFASRRTPVATYVRVRYCAVSKTSQGKKVDEVERRIALAEAIHSGVARVVTEKLPELKQCQGINNYPEGWYVQGAAGFFCEHGSSGHAVLPGEKMHVDSEGCIHCEAHAKP
jgi:hypothetical protein